MIQDPAYPRTIRPVPALSDCVSLVVGLCLFAGSAIAQPIDGPILAAAVAQAGEASSLALALAQVGQGPILAGVTVNGVDTGSVYEFVQKDGALLVAADAVREMGLRTPAGVRPDDLVDLSRLPGIRAELNPRSATVAIIASMGAQIPNAVDGGHPGQGGKGGKGERPNASGAAVNYDASLLATAGQTAFSGYMDARLFGRLGMLRQSYLMSGPADAITISRLNTTFVYADANSLLRFEAGDILSAGSAWVRPIGLAGLQLRRDFSLRPDLITFPTPTLSGSVVVPSSLDVYVNEVRRFSTKVQSGPFVLNEPPIIAGGGKLRVLMRDEAGRETFLTQPFYTSTALLRPGMYAFSVEAGRLREGFSFGEPSYGPWVAVGAIRRGFTSSLTGELHAEAASGLGMAGIGASMTLGTWAAAELAGSVSQSDLGRGGQVHASLERIEPAYSVVLSATASAARYQDIAARNGERIPELSLRASGGISLTEKTAVQLTYVSRRFHDAETDETSLGSLSLTHNFGRLHLYGIATRDFAARGTLLSVGLSMPLGSSGSLSAGSQRSPRATTTFVEATKPAIHPGEFGWRLGASEGPDSSQRGEVQYRSTVGLASLGLEQRQGRGEVRAAARGGVAFLGGRLYASDTIYDSFAVVETRRPNMSVLQENRLIGRTDRNGRLLVSSLRTYEDNQLALDALDVPMDADPKTLTRNIRPSAPGGWVVKFDLREGRSALLTLVLADGAAVPVGSTAQDDRTHVSYTVGYDGFVFLHDLAPSNSVSVVMPDGTRCAATFVYQRADGDLPEIGPTLCAATQQS